MKDNYPAALAFVWQPQFDSPSQGYHATPGDPGGGTYGGVIEQTWAHARAAGIVTGSLMGASQDQLSTVLRSLFWGSVCDELPAGVDLLMFNGRMMSGGFPRLFQQSLGLMGSDVDGWIGPDTLAAASGVHVPTFVNAVTGAHAAYLAALPTWGEFGNGWAARLKEAQAAAWLLAGKVV